MATKEGLRNIVQTLIVCGDIGEGVLYIYK